MSCAIAGFGTCSLQGRCRCAPFSGWRLSSQHEPGSGSTSQLDQIGRNELAPAALGVDQGGHWVTMIGAFDWAVAVVFPPRFAEFGWALPSRIVCLQCLDALDRIGAAEFQQQITDALTPLFKATERPTHG
jgi:hypothetical protein